MGRPILIILIILTAILFSLWQRAASGEPKPNMDNLIAAPEIIKYKRISHALFDFGGLQMLYRVTKGLAPYPQCDVIQRNGQEIMVVGHDPRGYVFFVRGKPVAFRTDHNKQWEPLVGKSYKKSEG